MKHGHHNFEAFEIIMEQTTILVTMVPKCIEIANTSLVPLLLVIIWIKLINENRIQGLN